MSSRLLMLMLAIVCIAATNTACGRAVEQPAPAPDTARAKPGAERHDATDASNTVSVSDEMLRDLRITTSRVEQRREGESTTLLGELGVNEDAYAEVGAPIPARVARLHAALGQTLARGAPLATLESGDLAKARSEVATAWARVDLAQRALARKEGLHAEHIVPTRELQEAETDKAAAEAQLRAAVASLQALVGGDLNGSSSRRDGSNSGVPGASLEAALRAESAEASALILRTPVAGVVLERAAVLGHVAEPSKPLFRIADLSTLWLTVRAFERDAVRLRTGAPARITFAAIPGRTFTGAIAMIGRSVDAQSRTVAVRIVLSNGDGLLRPGMSASARLPVGEAGATLLAVPAAALQRVRERWCLFVPKDERTFEIRPVGRGRDLGGEVEIVSGVRAGDTIVVDGAFLLKAETERGAGEGEHEEHR